MRARVRSRGGVGARQANTQRRARRQAHHPTEAPRGGNPTTQQTCTTATAPTQRPQRRARCAHRAPTGEARAPLWRAQLGERRPFGEHAQPIVGDGSAADVQPDELGEDGREKQRDVAAIGAVELERVQLQHRHQEAHCRLVERRLCRVLGAAIVRPTRSRRRAHAAIKRAPSIPVAALAHAWAAAACPCARRGFGARACARGTARVCARARREAAARTQPLNERSWSSAQSSSSRSASVGSRADSSMRRARSRLRQRSGSSASASASGSPKSVSESRSPDLATDVSGASAARGHERPSCGASQYRAAPPPPPPPPWS
mmetsp:Transcript_57048/g.156651  ORF Transcript_57048/g.156651 Transcript_57048/m.156651 type:complete len:318 (-) Transcript_57048:701-1654(-)